MGTIFNRLKLIYIIYQIVGIYYSLGICSAQDVSAFFVFGDSLVDAGNNYFINIMIKSEYPNGIDFAKGSPSRRYTNGRTVPDIIGEELGFKDYSPPYLDPTTTGEVILKGVNYGCFGSGILNSTGYIFGQHIGMSEQVDNFAKTRQEIISRIGEAAAKQLLRQALYFVVIGANDISARLISPSNSFYYLDKMISQFRSQLTDLRVQMLAVERWGGMVVYPSVAAPSAIFVKIESNIFSGINTIHQKPLI
ncbi:Lipase, GDSL [Corchorus olitorius]|uniref:Lipase, GDSL n=1 Tax=Corchorus olitorius TaxID=93759 RepID=A0A1R3H690_9ROSI|nr:Lipase, GDSL [Corchorus olitorius]